MLRFSTGNEQEPTGCATSYIFQMKWLERVLLIRDLFSLYAASFLSSRWASRGNSHTFLAKHSGLYFWAYDVARAGATQASPPLHSTAPAPTRVWAGHR